MEFHWYGIFLSTFLFDMRNLGICDIYIYQSVDLLLSPKCFFFSLWYVIQISLQNGLYLMGRAFLVQMSSVPHPQGRNAEVFQKTDLTRPPIQSDNTWILWILSRFNKIVHGSSDTHKWSLQKQMPNNRLPVFPGHWTCAGPQRIFPKGIKTLDLFLWVSLFVANKVNISPSSTNCLCNLIVCSAFGALSEAHPGLATGISESRNLGTQPRPEGLTVSWYTLKRIA